ncbi:hypothetical protein D7Y13_11085 [Corallococcus praedator]|uniref:TIGR02588 family protein n=1 Tax=Corallococcus praedator TaxID=2316724 RepID=A0ABX9QKI1_9BACT|nr:MULTISPECIES: hypothetical protein [Corallococcus]RKH09105.1 hypothetical protein D7X74_30235 [Corallococcus sp. CA047B]RKH31787.1 hypothetical protein D7X75_18235 [Corallococcus sp. CA031C]RKI11462.1 hypothetical protein D7Y13_11085 [Corallococcus praedator]
MKTPWNWLEGVVFVSSCVLVALVLGYLAVDAWTMGSGPPDLTVTVGTPVRGVSGWRVPVTVENHGDVAAEEVHVRVSLRGERPEQSELVLTYVPRQSQREGWVVFGQEPSDLEARAVGFATP